MLRFIAKLTAALVVLCLAGLIAIFSLLYYYGRDLPDYRWLASYEPPVMTRVHAGDGRLIAEYALEKRAFVPIEAMSKRAIKAFLAAEDKNFYNHPGIDFLSVVRAALTNIASLGSDRRPVGASTITQQVAKNFLLSNELSIERKVKEAILAFRIEHTFSKERILELYLNEIYLGMGSYGVAAAALNYFNAPLDELTIAEVAYLAALPKAPTNYHPIRHPEAAKARRDWVISRMLEEGFITRIEAEDALATPLVVRRRAETEFVDADFFTEEVRRELLAQGGEERLYKGGLSVRTSLDPRLQKIARESLRKELVSYDRRHGWRGPITRIDPGSKWQEAISGLAPTPGLGGWRRAVVLSVSEAEAKIGFATGENGRIPLSMLTWARQWLPEQKLGPRIRRADQVLKDGDVVAVEATAEKGASKKTTGKKAAADAGPATYALRQIPEIEGAVVAIDPHTGRVLALVGGYSFATSQFNRATQALRQPGSAFKPFVYLAALDEGYTPASLILDAPFVIEQGVGLSRWKPSNYGKEFYGPSTLRIGVEKSRNLMTVRLAQTIGMEQVAKVAERFGIVDRLAPILSMSLGAGETTLLRLTSAYAMLVNGGKRITPSLIDRIQDRNGHTVFRHDERLCANCKKVEWEVSHNQRVPFIPDIREMVTSRQTAYQLVSILHGVVERGTGRSIRSVGMPLAGKTGTTNESRDAWFIGFSPDLAVGVFTGFDTPRSLGSRETGASVAAPVFRNFMAQALANSPAIPFRIPPGIRLVRVNAGTGVPAKPGETNVILEAFKPGTEPTGRESVVNGYGDPAVGPIPAVGTGEIY
jgi:penicillin-binding protein 1A